MTSNQILPSTSSLIFQNKNKNNNFRVSTPFHSKIFNQSNILNDKTSKIQKNAINNFNISNKFIYNKSINNHSIDIIRSQFINPTKNHPAITNNNENYENFKILKAKIIPFQNIIEKKKEEYKFLCKKKISQSRQENSLGELTKNFINYIKKSGKNTVNINDLVKQLKVKKRRIYDITNVLEGIGYIKKYAKNEISWINNSSNPSTPNKHKVNMNNKIKYQIHDYLNPQSILLKKELEDLEKENLDLENKIDKIKLNFNIISSINDFSDYGYVTYNDLDDLCTQDKVDLITIKAPKGTLVDLVDPKESKFAYNKALKAMSKGKMEKDIKLLETLKKDHHLFLDSQKGEISIYRITNRENINQLINKSEKLKINNLLRSKINGSSKIPVNIFGNNLNETDPNSENINNNFNNNINQFNNNSDSYDCISKSIFNSSLQSFDKLSPKFDSDIKARKYAKDESFYISKIDKKNQITSINLHSKFATKNYTNNEILSSNKDLINTKKIKLNLDNSDDIKKISNVVVKN